MKKKNPAIGGFLNVLIAGLGHVYVGKWGRAIMTFVVVYVTLPLLYLLVSRLTESSMCTGLLFLSFVAVAFLDGYQGAKRHNEKISEEGDGTREASDQAERPVSALEDDDEDVHEVTNAALESPEAGSDNELPLQLTISSPIHLELVRVPAGKFQMGSNPLKDESAKREHYRQPKHAVALPEFAIGKYPVTNAQYATFVQRTDHETPKHWENGEIPSGKADHPVVHISWHDAVAFCEWLSQETSRDFLLPSEAEWEKAARGTDGRIYPWGDKSPIGREADLGCFGPEGSGTTPVGKYSPAGDSPYGCSDVAGNVWEWTRSVWGFDYPYDPKDGREDMEASGKRVLRGNAFTSMVFPRCACRISKDPDRRSKDLGFRVMSPCER